MSVFDLPWWQLVLGFGVWLNYLYWIFIHQNIFDGSDRFRQGEIAETATG